MTPSSDPLIEALTQLRLYGCLARVEEIRGEPWLERVMTIEREERTRRSLVHRTHLAGVGAFKPLCDFNWAWPKEIDRLRYEAGQPTPLSVPVTTDVRALTSVRTHALSTYDRLQSPKGEVDDDDILF